MGMQQKLFGFIRLQERKSFFVQDGILTIKLKNSALIASL